MRDESAPRHTKVIRPICEGTTVAYATGCAPGAPARAVQRVIDHWFAAGRVGVNVLWRHRRKEGLGDCGSLGVKLGRATDGHIIDQSTSANNE